MSRLAAVLLSALVALAVSGSLSTADDVTVYVVPGGGAAGGPALYLPHGDLLNVRNIQGGVVGDLNLDIGAGSTENPGDLVLNWDVGRNTLIYDGHKRLLARFGPSGIRFYRQPVMPRARRSPAWNWQSRR